MAASRKYLRVSHHVHNKELDLFCYVDTNPLDGSPANAVNKKKDWRHDIFGAYGFGFRAVDDKLYYQSTYALVLPFGSTLQKMCDCLEPLDPSLERSLPELATIACYKKSRRHYSPAFPSQDLYLAYWRGDEAGKPNSESTNQYDKLGTELFSALRGDFETCEYLIFCWDGKNRYYTSGRPDDFLVFRRIRLNSVGLDSNVESVFSFCQDTVENILKERDENGSNDSPQNNLCRTSTELEVGFGSVELKFNIPLYRNSAYSDETIRKKSGVINDFRFVLNNPLAHRTDSMKLLGITAKRSFASKAAELDSLYPLFKLITQLESQHPSSVSRNARVSGDSLITYRDAIEDRKTDTSILVKAVRVPLTLLNYDFIEAANLPFLPCANTTTANFEFLFVDEAEGFLDYFGEYRTIRIGKHPSN